MSGPEVEDIERVLAICFRTGEKQTSDDLERILSFDMGWMDTELAHDAIKALIFAGWIKDDEGLLSPNFSLKGIQAPLGWQPRPSRLTDPVVNELAQNVITPEPVIETKKIVEEKSVEEIVDTDPRSRVERRLLRYIAKQAGLDKEEISRRAERKVKALRHCTTWLALCLISREQGLEMGPIIESLSA